MPRKAATKAESAKEEEASAPARRSTRISSKPQSHAEPEPEPKKRKADAAERDGRKKKVKSPQTVDEDDDGDDDEKTPKISIDVGDYLPADMKLKNEQDEDIVLGDLGSDIDNLEGVVLFCVPKADTPGCTTQACAYRDSYPDFSSTGFQVYCLSADKPAVQEKWKTKKSLPYPLLSDPKRELITALGAGQGGKTQRSHFVFSKEDGKFKLVDKRIPVKPADSAKLALQFIEGPNSEEEVDEVEEE